jgi:lysylphosphatidylglycerol synthetase-like protein (DUF2156 family)
VQPGLARDFPRLLAFGGGLLLPLVMLLPWLQDLGFQTPQGGVGRSAYESFGLLDLVMLIVALLAVVAALTERPQLAQIGGLAGLATTLATLVRLVDRPGSNDVTALAPGAVFGVLCLVALTVGLAVLADREP